MSYDTNWAHGSNDSDVRRIKKEADKLARIACAAMTELVKHGKADFLVLQNDELREWWEAHQEADRKERDREARAQKRKEIKEQALARLTEEEKEALGLSKKKVDYDVETGNGFNASLTDEFLKMINSPNSIFQHNIRKYPNDDTL